MSDSPTPMELLRQFAPEFAKCKMDSKAMLIGHPNDQAVPAKSKILVKIAAAIGAAMCLKMRSRHAMDQVANDQQSLKAFLVARFMSQASANDFASETLADLVKSRISP